MLRLFVVCGTLLICALLHSEEPRALPAHWSPDSKDPIADALQVWRLGADYFKTPPLARGNGAGAVEEIRKDEQVVLHFETLRNELKVFTGFTSASEHFLRAPDLAPGVQFSCAVGIRPVEPALIKAMKESAVPEVQLQALVLLLRVSAPSTVEAQWATLQKLKALDKGPRWKELLAEMERMFDPKTLLARLADFNPPKIVGEMSRYGDLPDHTVWTMRAASVMQCKELLPKLREWSVNPHLDTSLEAERSLENFSPGPEADAALAACVRGWEYNAAEKAANVLLERNPKLLSETLLEMKPTDRLYIYGLLLGRCGDPRAVPILCKTVKEISIVDGSMFHFIETLAQPEHLELIKALPEQVRPEQKVRAERVVKFVLSKGK